jgi:hypothetical protein
MLLFMFSHAMSSCKKLPRRFRQKVVVVAVMTKQRPFRMRSSLDRTPMGKYRRSLVCFRYCLVAGDSDTLSPLDPASCRSDPNDIGHCFILVHACISLNLLRIQLSGVA